MLPQTNVSEKEEAQIHVRGVRLRQVPLGGQGGSRGEGGGGEGLRTGVHQPPRPNSSPAARPHRIGAAGNEARGGCSSHFSDIKVSEISVVAQKIVLNSQTQLSGARQQPSQAERSTALPGVTA